MMRVIFSLSFLVSLYSMNVNANYSGEIHSLGSNKTKKIFTIKNVTKEAEEKVDSDTSYFDNEGKLVINEKGIFKGYQLIQWQLEQKQMDTKASIEVADGVITFKKTSQGAEKTVTEKLKGEFVVSPTFQRFVKEKWTHVMAGKEVEFRFGSWERMESIGFEIFKIGEEKFNNQDVIVVKMKPSSFLVAALVKPLIFKFNKESVKLVAMTGRVAPKDKSGDSWKDLDAEVYYDYQ